MRKCGTCSLCCTVTRVPELNKPENVACSKCDSGCSIYDERPESCRLFQCEWLKGEMDYYMHPADTHIVMERLPGVPVVLALVEPGYLHMLEEESVIATMDAYSINGITVVASNGMARPYSGHSKEDVKGFVKKAARSMGVII